jgi:hypothetical protein
MPLPDPHAKEPTQELDPDKVKLLYEAKANMQGWAAEYNRLKRELTNTLGDAFAGTVGGEKVIYYRPRDQYALTALEKDYPDLVEHFKEAQVTYHINLERFRAQHSDILDKYQVRAFVERAL